MVLDIGKLRPAAVMLTPSPAPFRYAANVVGVEHVGLGSDFDGATIEPFDTTGLVKITEALLAQGFSQHNIRLIMGENTINLLLKTLPQ